MEFIFKEIIFMNKLFRFLILSFCVFSIQNSFSQIGGDNTFEFLNLTNSARISSMGGSFLAIKDDDISLALSNPSIITKEMDNHLLLSYVDYFADINSGFVSYSKTFEKYGSFVSTLQFINYGKFTRADAAGQTYDEFTASDYAFNIGWGRSLNPNFSIGSNLKFIYSAYDSYYASGIAVDVAGTYQSDNKQFVSSLIVKNIGRQLKAYNPENVEPLPFEIQLGLSKKLDKAPFRFSIVATHLEKWDLTYEDPSVPEETVDPLTGEELPEKKLEKFGDKLMRHIVIGGEFIPSKNFSVRFGYNYQRRKELQVESKVGMIGFSWGFGFKISKFRFSFGRASYHLGGATNHISITTNLSDFVGKKS